MLSVRNIAVDYDSFHALSDVSLDIQEGEIVALLGSNGAGKTTTMNTISGVTTLRSGTVSFNGQEIQGMPDFQRVDLGIVQVPEGRKLFPEMSVYENMLVGSYIKEARPKRKQNLEMCFEMFPKLHERRNQMAGSLSGGEQQMCAIARGLMACPKLLMLDEPSLGLAPVIVSQIFDIIQTINKDMGTTILLVEQNVLATLEIAHRGYVIETGATVLEGSARELEGNEELQKAYLGI
ncbi:ABC transporter ATP-binding protein [Oscillospiraceae bacterium MB08-C2-2]|nr:ABC transporter ATP-binding protein [Oscillospiraceae bacterium MB08-C2-2]